MEKALVESGAFRSGEGAFQGPCVDSSTAVAVFRSGPDPLRERLLPAGETSDLAGRGRVAGAFALPSGRHRITQITWWGTYRGNLAPVGDDFTIEVLADAAGRPALEPIVEAVPGPVLRVDSGVRTHALDLTLYRYEATLPGIELEIREKPATFWLCVLNRTDPGDWGWIGYTGCGDGLFHRPGGAGDWESLFGFAAFSLRVETGGLSGTS